MDDTYADGDIPKSWFRIFRVVTGLAEGGLWVAVYEMSNWKVTGLTIAVSFLSALRAYAYADEQRAPY